MKTALESIVSFEEFTVDPARRLLFKNGDIVSLNPKTFDLLLALIERQGKIVSKDELLDAVWGEQFVEEQNLTVNVSLLRKALGEKTNAPRFLITVPGRGYKFIPVVNYADAGRVENQDPGEKSPEKIESRHASEKPFENLDRINPKADQPLDIADVDPISTGHPHSLSKGERIANFEIIEEIGRGGMGEVYSAMDLRLNRKVAIKLLAAHITEDETRVRRFRQEAFATSALNHPNIVTIYEIGKWHNRDFIATEFIDGMTLRSFLQNKTLSIGETLDITLQIASALAAAHGAGVVHRDIKPENIIIRRDGLVKILDFGIAKYQASESGYKPLVETEIGEVIGTAAYMSPEQARGLEIDGRADIWSLGVILYEMIARKLPFPGETKSDRIVSILEKEPAPLGKTRRNVPVELEQIVSRALAKKKENRYSEIAEMAEDLHRLHGTTGEKRPTVLLLPPKRTFGHNQAYLLAALGAVFLIGSAVTIFFTDFGRGLWRQKNAPIRQSQQHLISTFPGSHSQASFSPDGKRIAFVNETDGAQQIWIRGLDGGEPLRISAENEFGERPRWSPVGDEILYVRGNQEKPDILKFSIENAAARKIINDGRNPNWSWDGKQIVFERGYEIWLANNEGGDQRRLEGVPPTDLLLADRMPAFSPDNSTIAFFQNEKGPIGDYWVIPSSGGEARRLTFDNIFGGAPVWMPGGDFIIFPSQRAGSMTLWRIAPEGGLPPEPVLTSAGEDTEPEISRDGRKLIYTNKRSNYSVMISNPATDESRTLRETRGVTVDASFSPDGSKILFFGISEGGDLQIFSINADGSNLTQITRKKGERNIHPQWSADGQAVYFYQIHPVLSFRQIPATGGESTELVHGWQWGEQNGARVSADGKRIIYSQLDKGAVISTKIRDLQDRTETAFATTLRHPRWSHDSQFVVGTDLPERRWDLAGIVVCSVEDENCRRPAQGYNPHWSADDSQIYYYRFGELKNGEELWRISATGENEEKVMDLQPMEPIGSFFDVSPTGEIVWIKYERGKNELWMADLPAN